MQYVKRYWNVDREAKTATFNDLVRSRWDCEPYSLIDKVIVEYIELPDGSMELSSVYHIEPDFLYAGG